MLGCPSRDFSSLRRGRSRNRGGESWKMFQRSLVPDQQADLTSGEDQKSSEEQDYDPDSEEEMSEQEKRRLPVRKSRLQNNSDESDDSEDESERAKRKRALRAFKEVKSSTKKGSRIKGRPRGDNSDTEEDEINEAKKTEVNKSKKQLKFLESGANNVKRDENGNLSECSLSGPSFPRKRSRVVVKTRRIVSDSEDSDDEKDDQENEEGDDASDDSFIDDSHSSNEDSQEDNANDDWTDMLENLKRRGDKFVELNSQYEESTHCRQLGGYDVSDDEERENKYPPRLLDDLREAVENASKEDGVEVAPELEDDNNKLIQRWEMYDVGESNEKDGECVCGRTGLRWLYFMRVKGLASWPFHTRVVGSECIRWFCRGNPRSILVVFNRLLKEGCVATYQQQLDNKCLLFTLGGNILPPFLREHKEFHQTEYTLPVEVREEDERVDIIVKPGTRGRVKDEGGKLLVKGGKYQVWVRPAVRPCKDEQKVPVLDFVLVKVQNNKMEREGAGKEKTGKDFIK